MSPTNELFRDAARRWLVLRRKNLRDNTYRKYNQETSILTEVLGKHTVGSLMEYPKPILDYLKTLNVTKKTISNRLIPLKGVYDMLSVETNMQIKYPLHNAKISMFLDIKKSTHEVDPFSLVEAERMLSKAGKMRNALEVSFFTGLRPSELYGLKWEDIGVDEIRVRRRLINGKEDDPKTESSRRSVAIIINGIPTRAKTALNNQKLVSSFNEYIFPEQISNQEFRRICRLAKVPYRNQYQIRHSYASNMLLDGANREWLAKQMGHKDTTMIAEVYGKWIKGSEITLSGNYITQSS
tara:strand:- start:1481 stop:2368 length:888 start_codon:yes stop_codon:yes gene_type:complete